MQGKMYIKGDHEMSKLIFSEGKINIKETFV